MPCERLSRERQKPLSGALLEAPVSEVKTLTKDAGIALGLYAADALHLATAIYLGARWLITDDGHLLSAPVQKYASAFGVAVINLIEMMVKLKV